MILKIEATNFIVTSDSINDRKVGQNGALEMGKNMEDKSNLLYLKRRRFKNQGKKVKIFFFSILSNFLQSDRFACKEMNDFWKLLDNCSQKILPENIFT